MAKNEVYDYLSLKLRSIFNEMESVPNIHEIRIRVGQPLMINTASGEFFISASGNLCDIGQAYIVKDRDIKEIVEYISNYSPYAYEEELRNGYITISKGNRIGVCGKAVVGNDGVTTIRNISSLNIRMSKEYIGCSDKYIELLYENSKLCHTLIISPPCCGKTTLLRDIIRNISDGYGNRKGMTIGVVDERSETAACYESVPQNNLGIRTDVMDACPKAYGILMLIRSMGPKVIAVDEIGAPDEVQAIKYAMHCGCKMIATVHGESLEEIRRKPLLEQMISEQCFERYVVLSNRRRVGKIANIYDKDGVMIFTESRNV